MLLGKRNPSNNPSLALSTETEIIANNSTYGTRQSNKKDGDGGGAIYGCRSSLGNEPCVRAVQPQGRPRLRVRPPSAPRAAASRPATPPARRSRPTPRASPPASTPTASTARRRPTSPPRPTSPRSPAACSTRRSAPTPSSARTAAAPSPRRKTPNPNNVYTVKFNKDVSKCSFTASPVGSAQAIALGVAADAQRGRQRQRRHRRDGRLLPPAGHLLAASSCFTGRGARSAGLASFKDSCRSHLLFTRRMLEVTFAGWAATVGLVVVLLAIDLTLAVLRPHHVGFREAALWSVFYIAVAIGFGVVVRDDRRLGVRRRVLRGLHRREEPVGRQPVRVRDHHEHVRGARRAPAEGPDHRDRAGADPAGDLHPARRRAARACSRSCS